METKKYQVFISSTYSDLIEERRKILDILLMADCIPAGMEAFVASDVEQFEVIKKVVELCDYYILIIGKRYGSINPATGKSYTQMEYEYAKQLGIPVLVFALDNSVELPEGKVDTDPQKVAALNDFRNEAMTNRLASIWKTQDELTAAVAISIMRAKTEIQRPGWQRATDYDEASLRREIMELEKENTKLQKELKTVKSELDSIMTPSDVAFENCTITIEYNHYISGHGTTTHQMTTDLPTLFKIISLEMLDVSLNESAISNILRYKLFPNATSNYTFKDPQITKTILNQLKALSLVFSQWSKEKSTLFWGLTKKGVVLRNSYLLMKEPEEPK